MAQSKPQNVFAPWDDPNVVPLIRFRNVTKRFGTFTAIDSLEDSVAYVRSPANF